MAKNDVEDGKVFAFLGIFLTWIGFLIVLLAKKDNKYAMYYAKQGLVLAIAWLIVSILGTFIPLLGWFVILPIGSLVLLIFWIMGIVYSLSGEMKPIPLIGKLAEKIKL
ncbi:DUF4870 domain-containing protein [Candidatus Woesearchaeota archaeon]|jgi:uncharacterized membrane protein|nr:DUF4870 domain-containing protein [Candidatus Woesearchaeota archaeon]